jgi:glycosyltransferase involved in cell wall biosynthesis
MGLKILWTSPYLPWPTVGGNKVRQYQLLRGLAEQGHRVTLLVQSKTPLEESSQAALAPLVERLIVLNRRPRKHLLTLAAALLAPYPVVVSVNGLSRALRAAMTQLLAEPWDAVHVEHSYGLQSLLGILQSRRQPFALTEHNVESSLTASTTYHPRLPVMLLPHLRRYDGWRYRRWERRALRAPTRLIAVTPEDARRLSAIAGRSVDVIANGVDPRCFADVKPNFGSGRLLFVGNFEYPPNAAAVEWAIEEIMPLVWERIPMARIAICGHAMPPAWRARWRDPRIEWRGFVADLAGEQRNSAILLAPLNAGGGSKLKVLEAMAAGLAVVSTPEGVSGLSVRDGREYREGRTAEELAARVTELLPDAGRLAALGDSARAYVQRSHDWRQLTAELVQIYLGMPKRD